MLGDVVGIRKKNNKILLVKFILNREIFNVISVYASQIGHDEFSKYQF